MRHPEERALARVSKDDNGNSTSFEARQERAPQDDVGV
jgi:hypothetical protein